MNSEKKLMVLSIYAEVTGKISSVTYSDEIVTIILNMNKSYELQIPRDILINEYKLKDASGFISILRTEFSYYIRDIMLKCKCEE